MDEISTNTKTFVQRYIEEEIASSEFSGQGQKKICLTTSSKIKSFVHSGIFFRKIYFTSQFSLFLYISFDINMAPILTNMWMYGIIHMKNKNDAEIIPRSRCLDIG